MQLPQVTEVRGINVLTTRQIAEMYGTTKDIISYNFNYNKKRYVEGKHYISLQGDELRAFKASREIQGNLKYAHILYLWTEKGALLHAKSLNTNKAWDAYDYLVDYYFRAKEAVQLPKEPEKPKASAPMVVNVTGNLEIQRALKEADDYLISLRIALKEYNACRSEKSHHTHYMMVNNILVAAVRKICYLLELKPELIQKQ